MFSSKDFEKCWFLYILNDFYETLFQLGYTNKHLWDCYKRAIVFIISYSNCLFWLLVYDFGKNHLCASRQKSMANPKGESLRAIQKP